MGLTLTGCTDFADSAEFDAGISDGDLPFDGGGDDDADVAEDSGPPPEDAGPPVEDAGPMDAGDDAEAPPMCVSVMFTVGSDHDTPHATGLSFPAADVIAGEEMTYDIRGSSAHPHMLTVTAADFTTLAGGGSVTITSTNDNGHTHDVTLQCMS